MKNRKLLPLSLSIAAISLLALGFSNVGFVANAATGGVQDEPLAQAAPVSTAAAAAPEVSDAPEAVILEAENTVAAQAVAPAECPCDNPGDCGIPGCPQAACIAGGCAGGTLETADGTGCLCQDGGCGLPGCPGAGCDGTNCPALQGESGCGCSGEAIQGCGGACAAQDGVAPARSGCGCR